jgi:hypothetical protein
LKITAHYVERRWRWYEHAQRLRLNDVNEEQHKYSLIVEETNVAARPWQNDMENTL